jgi:hypothetical protein
VAFIYAWLVIKERQEFQQHDGIWGPVATGDPAPRVRQGGSLQAAFEELSLGSIVTERHGKIFKTDDGEAVLNPMVYWFDLASQAGWEPVAQTGTDPMVFRQPAS